MHCNIKILAIYNLERFHKILYCFNWIFDLLFNYKKRVIFLIQITVSIIILWISLWILVTFEMLLNHYVSWLAIIKNKKIHSSGVHNHQVTSLSNIHDFFFPFNFIIKRILLFDKFCYPSRSSHLSAHVILSIAFNGARLQVGEVNYLK